MTPIDQRIFGPDNDADWQRKQREKSEKRRSTFDQIAEEAIAQLNLAGQTKSWKIDADLTTGITEDRIIQELCNAIIAAQAKANGETNIAGYPTAIGRETVEEWFEIYLTKIDDDYNLTLKAKGTFSFRKN